MLRPRSFRIRLVLILLPLFQSGDDLLFVVLVLLDRHQLSVKLDFHVGDFVLPHLLQG